MLTSTKQTAADLIPTHGAPTYDRNYNTVREPLTVEERIRDGNAAAAMWDRKAAEFERSADTWAAQGQHEQAGRNLETAKNYRAEADAYRAAVAEIVGEGAEPMRQAAE